MFGQGNGGNVVVNARDGVLISGRSPSISRSSISAALSGTGNAGNIEVTTPVLRIEGGGEIDATANGRGSAGKIFVNASDSVVIDGSAKVSDDFQSAVDRLGFSGSVLGNLQEIISSSRISSSAGFGDVNGGEIQISTGNLTLTNGGSIAGYSLSGNSAKITINARESVILDGVSKDSFSLNGQEIRYRSGINNEVSNGGTGNASAVRIETDGLSILNGASISSNTAGGGKAGDIVINARDRVLIDGQQFNRASNISNSSGDTILPDGTVGRGRGNSGAIAINTGTLVVRNSGAIVSASGSDGKAGNIDINASQVRLENQAQIFTAAATVDGGSININSSGLLLLRNSSLISTTTGIGNPQGTGTGGNININARFLVAIPKEDSDISADATRGRGGNININAQAIFGIQPRSQASFLSDITASSNIGVSGNITLNSPDTSAVQNTLSQLPTNPIDTSALLANSCIVRRDRRNSTFYITGSSSLPIRPGDAPTSPYPTGELQPIPSPSSSAPRSSSKPWKMGDPIVEPQGAYQLPDGQLILSRECS